METSLLKIKDAFLVFLRDSKNISNVSFIHVCFVFFFCYSDINVAKVMYREIK